VRVRVGVGDLLRPELRTGIGACYLLIPRLGAKGGCMEQGWGGLACAGGACVLAVLAAAAAAVAAAAAATALPTWVPCGG